MSHRLPWAVAACVGLAAASLLAAAEPVYDAWAWLVWGRELTHLRFDAATGPSWKPLTVALAAALSLAGDSAPALWLVLVRAAWLLSFVLAAELAHRLTAGRPPAARLAAAAFAALGLVLLSDGVTAWVRQAAGGMSEPLLVALVLGAVRVALAGRVRWALVLGALAALLRPEAWPLLALYGLWSLARASRARARSWWRSPSRCPRSGWPPSCSPRAAVAPGARRARRATRSRRWGGRPSCRSRSRGRWRCWR